MIIFRYLCKEIFATLLATILILLIIFITNQFVHYLNDAAAGKITTRAVMEVMTLQVPMLLGYLLPLSLFLGILLTLGRFYVDHEMVVLTACGVSRAQFVGMIMLMATLVTGIVAWLMLSVEPKMQWYQGKILQDAVAQASLDKVLPGRFQPLGKNGRVFYAGKVAGSEEEMGKKMGNVLLAQRTMTKNHQESWDLVAAEQANEFMTSEDGRFILFKKGVRYIGVPGERQYHVTSFDVYGIRMGKPVADLSGRTEAMPTTKLWHVRRTNKKAASELQWRLAMPLSVLVFALLALPLSYVNPRKGKFAQMLPAILIYIAYADLLFVGRAWIEKGVVSPDMGLWWVHGVVLLLALILLAVQKSWRHVLIWARK